MGELPAGTVTFMFTDLEGSTRLWELHPDAMQGALARHDDALRSSVEGHGGHVVKMQGDGVHAVFATADAAIIAAVAAQRALSDERWEVTGPLRVRIGIHTGTATLREGDYSARH
jgi:class 3 adenylate cyclase